MLLRLNSIKNILQKGRSPYLNHKRNGGYVVLVPEIGDDLPVNNPLIRPDGLPEFNNITIEKCIATIGKQTIDFERTVKEVEDKLSERNVRDSETESPVGLFHNIVDAIEPINVQLDTTWGLAKTLYLGNSVLMPTKSYMLIHERAIRARTSKYNSRAIYQAMKQIKNSPEWKGLDSERQRIVDLYLLEGKLNGIGLIGDDKALFDDLSQKLNHERTQFGTKIRLAISKFSEEITDYNVVRDFPADYLQTIGGDEQLTRGPWKITLQPMIYNRFLEYCPDRKLRWNVWQANTRKGSGHVDRSIATSVNLEVIRDLRQRQANLLGYKTYADMSMETKSIGSVDNVRNLLGNLQTIARPAQEQELMDLSKFATKSGFEHKLEACDVPYWKRKQFTSIHQCTDDQLREYFPVPRVLAGLFQLAEQLFGVKVIRRQPIDSSWHEDVRFYDVFDLKTGGREPIAGFYLDLYCREEDKIKTQEKNGWTIGICNRSRSSEFKPLTALIFNFPAPLYGKPSLLTTTDVETIFFKFGHALQILLSRTNYTDVAGLSNIEWDAVEVCGNVFSNLLYDKETLKSISQHYVTEETIPDQLVTAIQSQRTHMAGYRLSDDLYLSALDLELHTSTAFWLDLVKNLWPQYKCLPMDKKDVHPCSWTDIMSGDWAAGYYSHIWSRLVAADVYSAFHEEIDSKQDVAVGQRFRDTYLSVGGSSPHGEVFRRFRGRDPSADALIGMLKLERTETVTHTQQTTDQNVSDTTGTVPISGT